VRSVESAALALLRALDEASAKQKNHEIEARTATEVALYLLNEKRDTLATIEENRGVRVRVSAGQGMSSGDFEINIGADTIDDDEIEAEPEAARRPRRAVELEAEAADEAVADIDADDEEEDAEAAPEAARADGDGERRGRRRRGRRGGRRRREDGAPETAGEEGEAKPAAAREAREPREERGDRGERGRNGRRRRRGRGRGRRVYEVDGGEWLDFVSGDLKHLSPRPDPRARQRPESEPIEAVEAQAEEPTPTAEVIAHPAAEPVYEAVEAPVPVMAEAEDASAPVRYEEPAPEYEPDQERRDKFLARFSRWGKKGG
jgi:ribonuclease E